MGASRKLGLSDGPGSEYGPNKLAARQIRTVLPVVQSSVGYRSSFTMALIRIAHFVNIDIDRRQVPREQFARRVGESR